MQNINLKAVVIESVNDNSPAMRVGFQKKDLVLEVNGIAITSTKQLEELLKTPRDGYKLTVKRGDRTINIILSGNS